MGVIGKIFSSFLSVQSHSEYYKGFMESLEKSNLTKMQFKAAIENQKMKNEKVSFEGTVLDVRPSSDGCWIDLRTPEGDLIKITTGYTADLRLSRKLTKRNIDGCRNINKGDYLKSVAIINIAIDPLSYGDVSKISYYLEYNF